MAGETDASRAEVPRFDHGENLEILAFGDGTFEFRTTREGESLRSDATVYVETER